MSNSSEVEIAAPTGNPLASVTIQSVALAPLPGAGPLTVHPSSPDSNDCVLPSGSVMSSRNTPRFWVAQSLAYEIEISTALPAYAFRFTDHCCQPPEFPDAAF